MQAIKTSRGYVEYASFCGDSVECVGFGTASLYDGRQARLIKKMLRKLGIKIVA
jgi:hypothetical protein